MRPIVLVLCTLMANQVPAADKQKIDLEHHRQANWFAQNRLYNQQLKGVVEDSGSGLLWQQHSPKRQLSWDAAKSYCASLNLAQIDHWRLPSRLELLSLLNYDNPEHAYDSHYFQHEPPVAFWSGTVYDNMPSHVWIAQFGEGDMYCLMRVAQAHVRCVA